MILFRDSFDRFLKDERGVLLAEFLILIPILVWGFIALFVYWDLFRVMNVAQKATYGIADMISRQADMSDSFIDGQQEILDFLTPGAADAKMRITSLQLDEGKNVLNGFDGDDKYCLLFSRGFARGGAAEAPAQYTDATIQDLNDRIPDMNGLDAVVIVETWVDYRPSFDTGVLNFAPGVSGQTFYQFVVTRPRGDWRRVTLKSQPFTCAS